MAWRFPIPCSSRRSRGSLPVMMREMVSQAKVAVAAPPPMTEQNPDRFMSSRRATQS